MYDSIESLYQPFRKHAELYQGTFPSKWLHEDFLQIIEAFSKAKDDQAPDTIAPALLHKEMDGVYSFNVFTTDFLQLFNEEIDHFYKVSKQQNIPVRRPNSMNNYGVVVNEIGLRPLITAFQQRYLWPISRLLFPVEASQFDTHHSFIVRYQANEDLGLDMHIDDSDVTFNVCLGYKFTDSTLVFCGMFGAPNHRQHSITYTHQVGRAIIHLGSRRHGADDISSGTRSNLIIWNHNLIYRSSGGNRNVDYQKEEGPPAEVCLSFTHDRDYQTFKKLPVAAKGQRLKPWCPPAGKEYKGFEPSN